VKLPREEEATSISEPSVELMHTFAGAECWAPRGDMLGGAKPQAGFGSIATASAVCADARACCCCCCKCQGLRSAVGLLALTATPDTGPVEPDPNTVMLLLLLLPKTGMNDTDSGPGNPIPDGPCMPLLLAPHSSGSCSNPGSCTADPDA
jgi:hypothetical protein